MKVSLECSASHSGVTGFAEPTIFELSLNVVYQKLTSHIKKHIILKKFLTRRDRDDIRPLSYVL